MPHQRLKVIKRPVRTYVTKICAHSDEIVITGGANIDGCGHENIANEEILGGDNTGKDDATIEGNGDGNGQVPPRQTEDENGGIHNPADHYPPGLNKGIKPEKPDNPNKPDKPGQEDSSDKKAQKGTHMYTYDPNNRVVTGNVAKILTNY